MQEPLIPGGYILLSRKIIESQIWEKPPLYLKVWIYLLSLAQHKDYKQLKRGQLRTSIPEIIEACSWRVGARTERPSKDQIFQILEWLRTPEKDVFESNAKATRKATAITTTKATHGMLINIDNYCLYQDSKNYESNVEGNNESNAVTPTNPDNINKNEQECNKNDLKDINDIRPKRVYDPDSPYVKMTNYLLTKIREWKSDFVFRGNIHTWADDFRKIHELDKRSKDDIRSVIDWATSDSFWQSNILSPDKLRKKFDTLQAQMSRPRGFTKGGEKLESTSERDRKRREEELNSLSL